MTQKFTLETVKNLKVKIKDLGEEITRYYTEEAFSPSDSFQLATESCNVDPVDGNIVVSMIDAFNSNDTEFEAGRILYESIQLSPQQASDIGFWTYQNHYIFYPYIARRWAAIWKDDVENPSSYIINHWVQTNTTQGELIDYPISGLWWSFYLTVDKDREDKYELTKVFFKNESIRTKLLGTARFARHKPAILGILEFIKEKGLDTHSIEQAGRAFVPYINLLGGIRPLTYFDKDWFKQKLEEQFGEKISKGEKIFMRPGETDYVKKVLPTLAVMDPIKVPDEGSTYNHYFCLNSGTGNYNILTNQSANWEYCVGLDFENPDQFLIHFYSEGKIKKTKVEGGLSEKIVNRPKPYSNGKCPKLTVYDIQAISQPVLFGIAYKTRTGIYFKAMDEQIVNNFRTDNVELNQEGKKVLYIPEKFKSAYKILPYSIKEQLGSLVQLSPIGKGSDIENPYYQTRWNILKKHWPELFDGTIEWK